jgi:hypothetical protein
MPIARVMIQKDAGEFVSPNGYAAWRGFVDRGFETAFFEWPALRDGQLDVEPSTLIVGGVGAVTFALKRLGLAMPTIDDLPEPLAEFRGRRVWRSTLADIRGNYKGSEAAQPAVFVKPLRDPKAFPAQVVAGFRDLIPTSRMPGEAEVLASDPIEFVSEWRFFVLRGRVVGGGWYAGDPLTFPDAAIVGRAVNTWGAAAPAGYGIDFGIAADGRTLLVEVNEGYSLGCLGLRPMLYSQILEARWIELMKLASQSR